MNLVRWCNLMEAALVIGFLSGFIIGMALGCYAWLTLM